MIIQKTELESVKQSYKNNNNNDGNHTDQIMYCNNLFVQKSLQKRWKKKFKRNERYEMADCNVDIGPFV